MENGLDSRLAFVFPGQGSQYTGMGKDIFENFKTAKLIFEEASDVLKTDMKKLIFGDDKKLLDLTENTQPAILIVSIAILNVLMEEYGISALCTSGHSLGEYSANVYAGSLDMGDALRITKKRGVLMQNACPVGFGKMAAVIGLDIETIKETINFAVPGINAMKEGGAYIANYNSPVQTVISGEASAIDKVCSMLKEKGAKKIVFLPVSAPFHTPYMKEAKNGLESFFNPKWFKDAEIDIFSNATALNYSKKEDVMNLLLEQVTAPVKWEGCVLNMKKLYNIDIFIEIGPSNVLTGLIKRIQKGSMAVAVDSIESIKGFNKALTVNS